MILSIVTGTYNRLQYLQGMIASARDQIPRHIPHEFVIVDGGSTDGTLEWLRKQSDVVLLEHGALRGAIRAFTEGARLARGEYVILANDDVVFRPYSIMRALSYLEEHPACGAVAFADDRAAQMGDADGHRVLGMAAVGLDGQFTMVPYAQVGMFRRWLGDLAGWWGHEDEIMRKARTYGGDNYLSSRIWELGYSVDEVKGCVCDDLIVRDEMRASNHEIGIQDSSTYYYRYPKGPRLQPGPTIFYTQQERLRVLVLPIYEPRFPGRYNYEYGLSEALAKVALTWEIDYVNEPFDLAQAVAAWQPDLLFTQLHNADDGKLTPAMIHHARELKPDMVVVNWNGDAHEKGLTDPGVLDLLRLFDLQTVTNAKVLPLYAQEGIPAAFWQIGYKDPARALPSVPQHDVLFLGNCYNQARRDLVQALRATGHNVGVYGWCPEPDGNTHYDFAMSRALYERCTLAVGDTFPDTVAFVSNRFFQALSAGAFLLQQEIPEFEHYTGLIAGEHYVKWYNLDDLADRIDEWLLRDKKEERERIAKAGQQFVREHFSYDAQITKLWKLLQ